MFCGGNLFCYPLLLTISMDCINAQYNSLAAKGIKPNIRYSRIENPAMPRAKATPPGYWT